MARGMNNLQANICLLAVTLCWSCEVIIFSVIPDGVNPFATTCVTSLIGAVLLGACFARRIAEALRLGSRVLVRRVATLSVLNTAYSVCFLIGLDYFDVSTGAFTISITAVVLPVMLLVMRRGVGVRTWVSAGCVLTGIVVDMVPSHGSSDFEGLAVMAVGCLIRAVYIVKVNDWAREHDPLALSAGMLGLNAILAFFPWLAMQPATFAALPWSGNLVAAYFVYGYFVAAFATALNILAQRRATPAQATIIYSTEIVMSTIWATCLPASVVDPVDLTWPIVVGCALVVIGSLVEIMPVGSRKEDIADTPQAKADVAAIAADSDSPATHVPNLLSALPIRIKSPFARGFVTFVILLGVYMIIALPFKQLSVIPGFTDIRPVCMLMPVYGIFFGIPGCFACAVGNLIGDIASDSLRWSSIAGFVGNFAYPFLMYAFWTKIRKKPFALRRVRTICLFVAIAVACSLVQALIITPAVAFYYPDVDAPLFFASVVANSSLFPLGFTIPFIIMLQDELGFRPLGYSRSQLRRNSWPGGENRK